MNEYMRVFTSASRLTIFNAWRKAKTVNSNVECALGAYKIALSKSRTQPLLFLGKQYRLSNHIPSDRPLLAGPLWRVRNACLTGKLLLCQAELISRTAVAVLMQSQFHLLHV